MDDFGDFGSEAGMDTFQQMDNGDPFASAGGIQMSGQSDSFAAVGLSQPENDYTFEEQDIIQRVQTEQEDKKRQLYEKQMAEDTEKQSRKLAAQR